MGTSKKDDKMKKLFILLTITLTSAFAAQDGAAIYKVNCAMCHANTMKSQMQAPPMPKVSMHLKMKLKSREEFIAFVEDYIQNPSQEKGFCMPMAYKRFGTMPPIGKSMTKEERATIAAWLYDNYKDSMGGKMCEMRNKNMKKMKCGGGKCGAVKIETH